MGLIVTTWVEGDFRDMTRVAEFVDYASCEREGSALQIDFMDRALFVKTARLLDEGKTFDKDSVRSRTVVLFDCIRVPLENYCIGPECDEEDGLRSTTEARALKRIRREWLEVKPSSE